MWLRLRNIWFKELRDSLRDRKALRQAILVPVIIGIVYAAINPILMTAFTSRAERESEEALVVSAHNIDALPQELVTVFTDLGMELNETDEAALRAAVEAGDQPVGLIVPDGFAGEVADEVSAEITLLTNPSSGGSFDFGIEASRVNRALTAYSQQLVAERLAAAGVDVSVLTPIAVNQETLITAEQQGGINAGFMLPILVAVVVVTGGIFIAIDVTAGEKERGTLESLLLTPATDGEILVGKLLAVFTMATVPLVLTFLAFGLATNLLPDSLSNGATISPIIVAGSILASLPLALAVTVVLMIIAVRTKTFKDAQSAVSPVTLATIFPAMAAAFFPPSSLLLYAIPVYGTAAVVGRLATTGVFPWVPFLFSMAGSLVVFAVGVWFGLRLFNRERLLYSM